MTHSSSDPQLIGCSQAEAIAIAAKYLAKFYHEGQYRKGPHRLAYETHLCRVSTILQVVLTLDPACPIRGDDPLLQAAAWLHDALEDQITPADLMQQFRSVELLALCKELCNPPHITDLAAKQAWQLTAFPSASPRARLLKLADQMANVISTIEDPPLSWPLEKQQLYNDKARAVAGACAGVSPLLDQVFTLICDRADALLAERRDRQTDHPPTAEHLMALGRSDRERLRNVLHDPALPSTLPADRRLTEIIDCVELVCGR